MKKLNTGVITAAVSAIVFILILFTAYSVIVPTAQTQGDELGDEARCGDVGCFYNATGGITGEECYSDTNYNVSCADPLGQGIPLGGLFSSSGIVFVIIMAALLIVIVRSQLKK